MMHLPDKPTPEEFNRLLLALLLKARRNPGQLVRLMPGWYFVSLSSHIPGKGPEVLEIEQYTHDWPKNLRNWWIAREYNGSWYSDPHPTLRDLKQSLGLIK